MTSAIRGAPGEVVVGIDKGLKRESAVNLDPVQTVDKTRLRRFLGSLSRQRMTEVCKSPRPRRGLRELARETRPSPVNLA